MTRHHVDVDVVIDEDGHADVDVAVDVAVRH